MKLVQYDTETGFIVNMFSYSLLFIANVSINHDWLLNRTIHLTRK